MFQIDRLGSKRPKPSVDGEKDDNEERWLESIVFKDSRAALTAVRSKQQSIDSRRREQLDGRDEEEEEKVNFILDNAGDASLLEGPNSGKSQPKDDCVWQDDDDDVGFVS